MYRREFILVILTICAHVVVASTGDQTAIIVNFESTSGVVASGNMVTLTITTSRPVTSEVQIDLASCAADEVTTSSSVGVVIPVNMESGESTLNVTSSSPEKVLVDFFITGFSETGSSTTLDNLSIGQMFSTRFIVTNNAYEVSFPTVIYPASDMRIQSFESDCFEFYVFLSQEQTTDSAIGYDVDDITNTLTASGTCTVQAGNVFATCVQNVTDVSGLRTGGKNVNVSITTASGSGSAADAAAAYYDVVDSTMDSSTDLVFFQGLKVVEENVGTVEIVIAIPTPIDAPGTIELEVEPENLSSYLVSPLIIDVNPGNVVATATVTVLDDTVDEGAFEMFRIKMLSSTGITNQPSTKAQTDGMLFVIVDNDVSSVEITDRDVCLTEGDECYDLSLKFDSPVAVPQRGDWYVCDSSGSRVTDSRDIVPMCTYDIPTHSCGTGLCFCVFEDFIPEDTKDFFVVHVPPEVSQIPSQVVRVRILDDDTSSDDQATIDSVTASTSGLDENSGSITINITASTAITGTFELRAIAGTAELDVDYQFGSGSTFFYNEMTQTIIFDIIDDNDYEVLETVTLIPYRSPVEIGATVADLVITWTDDDFGLAVYPKNIVGYENCPVEAKIFVKGQTTAVTLTHSITSGAVSDISCSFDSATISVNGFVTLTCTPVLSLSTADEGVFVVVLQAAGGGAMANETVQITVQHYNTTPPNYHPAQDLFPCFAGSSCDVSLCVKTGGDTNQSATFKDDTAFVTIDYPAPTSVTFNTTVTASSPNPELQTPPGLSKSMIVNASPQFVEEYQICLDVTSEVISVLNIPSLPLQINDYSSSLMAGNGKKYFACEGENFFVPELFAFQDMLLTDGLQPEFALAAEGGSADLNVDFQLSVEEGTHYVYVRIIQDDEVEALEEFVIFVQCNTAIPTNVFFTATICIIDDDKEEPDEPVSTTQQPFERSTFKEATTQTEPTSQPIPTTGSGPTIGSVRTTRDFATTQDGRDEPTTADGLITTDVTTEVPGPSTTPVDSNCFGNEFICDENAACIMTGASTGFCQCNSGFQGSGFFCDLESVGGRQLDCPAGLTLCSDLRCIKETYVCDGKQDCANDEDNCAGMCRAVAPPLNGFQMNSQASGLAVYPEGSIISFACDAGYTLVGSETLTCLAANFGEVPECKADCPFPPEIVDPNAKPSGQTSSHGSLIDYICAAGFQGSPVTITCKDGTWEGTSNFPFCRPTGYGVTKRYRSKMRITAFNDSEILAEFRLELLDANTFIFRLYEEQVCTILNDTISGYSETLQNNLKDCFAFSFRNGSVIPYLAIDVIQTSPSPDLSSEMEAALRAVGTQTPGGLLLTNKDGSRRILIDDGSIDIIDTSTYGCYSNNICTNGGTCLEDIEVYDYQCSCPPNYLGEYCQIDSHRQTASTVAVPSDVSRDTLEFPAWTLALLAASFLLLLSLCFCCCCLVYWSREKHPVKGGVYRYPGSPTERGMAIRNPFRGVEQGTRHPYYNDPWHVYDGGSVDEATRIETHDDKRLSAISDILSHSDFLNNRMKTQGAGRDKQIVVNPHAERYIREFSRPLVVDGSETRTTVNETVPRRRESIELSETSSESSQTTMSSLNSESRI